MALASSGICSSELLSQIARNIRQTTVKMNLRAAKPVGLLVREKAFGISEMAKTASLFAAGAATAALVCDGRDKSVILEIDHIGDGEHCKFEGLVRVKNIGRNATVIIQEGSLMVDGDIGEGSRIFILHPTPTRKEREEKTASTGFFPAIPLKYDASTISVAGNLEKNVIIKTQTAHIRIHGSVGKNAALHSARGDIDLSSVEQNAVITAHMGSISASKIHGPALLSTVAGNITVENIGENVSLQSKLGDIYVQDRIPSTAVVTSELGHIYQNGLLLQEGSTKDIEAIAAQFASGNRLSDCR